MPVLPARLILCFVFLGCGSPPTSNAAPDARVAEPRAAAEIAPSPDPTPPNQIRIPAGTVSAGSPPGTPLRRPSREADGEPIELHEFAIDRLPYPGDPFAPPRLVASRAEAAALCAARGARLCTELEWERACEGDSHTAFAGGSEWTADRCSQDPSACASEFGVLGLGESAPEWTASDVPPSSIRMGRNAILRGARSDAPADLHRCDARVFDAGQSATPAAFRCCEGEPNASSYPEIREFAQSTALTLSSAELRTSLRSVPELAPYADTFEPHGAAELEGALSCGAGRRGRSAFEFARGPFVWSPSRGEEVWVIAGRSAGSTVVMALYPLPDGSLAHASSFVLENEDAPIAIARNVTKQGELEWSTCWGQLAEGGTIQFGEDSLIRISQR